MSNASKYLEDVRTFQIKDFPSLAISGRLSSAYPAIGWYVIDARVGVCNLDYQPYWDLFSREFWNAGEVFSKLLKVAGTVEAAEATAQAIRDASRSENVARTWPRLVGVPYAEQVAAWKARNPEWREYFWKAAP